VNELIAAILAGLLLSLSAGVRITVPLLAVNILAFRHVITLPKDLAWRGAEPARNLLSVACAVEMIVHFIPVIGTWIKAVSTPLAFAAGTLLMAVPLGDRNPLLQWILAGGLGGGAALLTHLGVTGARTATGPVNLASGGTFGLVWNLLESFASFLFVGLGGIFVFVGLAAGLAALVLFGGALAGVMWEAYRRWSRWRVAGIQDEALP
jgi:hypothetical protein